MILIGQDLNPDDFKIRTVPDNSDLLLYRQNTPYVKLQRLLHACAGEMVNSFWLLPMIRCILLGMNAKNIVGIIMIVAGAALLAYGGFTTTKRENIIDAGPIKIQADVTERHIVPPALAWALLGGGVVVLIVGMKKK